MNHYNPGTIPEPRGSDHSRSLKELTSRLRKELVVISKMFREQTQTVETIKTIISTGSTGLSNTGVVAGTYSNPTLTVHADGRIYEIENGAGATPYKSGINAVLSTGTPILFSGSIGSVSPFVKPTKCYNGLGDVGVTISGVTEFGFTATPVEDATLEWYAVPYGVPFDVMGIVTTAGDELVWGVDLGTTSYVVEVIACYGSDGVAVGIDSITKATDRITVVCSETATFIGKVYPCA